MSSSKTASSSCQHRRNRRRGRRLLFVVSAIAVDIVVTFEKMSTKSDQAHLAPRASGDMRFVLAGA